MTQQEAEMDRIKLKLWLVNYKWDFLTTVQRPSKKKGYEDKGIYKIKISLIS